MSNNKDFLQFLQIQKAIEQTYALQGAGLPLINRFACELSFEKGGDYSGFPFQVLSADIPNFALAYNEIELFGEKRYNYKNREDGDLGITFLETPELKIRQTFYAWMHAIFGINNDGTVSRQYPDDDKLRANIIVYPIDSLGGSKLVDRFKGVAPYDISGIPYTYSDTELIKTTVKFKYKYHHLTEHGKFDPAIS